MAPRSKSYTAPDDDDDGPRQRGILITLPPLKFLDDDWTPPPEAYGKRDFPGLKEWRKGVRPK